MSTESETPSTNWVQPNELIKLQRLRQRKRKLAARLSQNNNTYSQELNGGISKEQLLEAKIAQKRKNPFAKSITDDENSSKKFKPDAHEEDSLFSLICNVPTQPAKDALVPETSEHPKLPKLVLKPFDQQEFAKLLQQTNQNETDDDDDISEQNFTKHLPMDWSLKTRIRFFSHNELPATTLKTSQMASGLTCFVRCNNSCSGLDTSSASRFNQSTYYWQHPYLPWVKLYPRNSKENIGLVIGEKEKKALASDWDASFRGLFHLLRARQCPYFYLCANTFTVLFRAAGTCGRVEIHALMTPSTRGMRQSLREDGIEFSMPLKKDNGGGNKTGEGSFPDESTRDGSLEKSGKEGDTLDDDDDDDEEWLESLGVNEREIRKIQTAYTRRVRALEMEDDFSDNSLLLIEGVECQGFVSYLLNAKITISSVGRLAGVPPTLLAPVAFPKATMQHLAARSSKVRLDGVDYCSVELKGIILPTVLPYVCQLLGETKKTFSATIATSNLTVAFSKATQKLIEEPKQEEAANSDDMVDMQGVFGKENLADCGLRTEIIEDICRTEAQAVALLERVCYDKDYGYAWS